MFGYYRQLPMLPPGVGFSVDVGGIMFTTDPTNVFDVSVQNSGNDELFLQASPLTSNVSIDSGSGGISLQMRDSSGVVFTDDSLPGFDLDLADFPHLQRFENQRHKRRQPVQDYGRQHVFAFCRRGRRDLHL